MNIGFLDPSQQFNSYFKCMYSMNFNQLGGVEQIADSKIILSDEATYITAIF